MTTALPQTYNPLSLRRVFMYALLTVAFSILFILSGGANAFANPPDFGGGSGSVGGGGAATGPGSSRNNPIDNGAPRGRTYGKVSVNPNNYNFKLPCTNWSGSGSYKPSASCNVTKNALYGAAKYNGRSKTQSWGIVLSLDAIGTGGGRWAPAPVSNYYPAGYTSVRGEPTSLTCGAQGTRSGYAQTWNLTAVQTFRKTSRFVRDGVYQDPTSKKWVVRYKESVPGGNGDLMGESIAYEKRNCQYPKIVNANPVYCYWNYNGQSLYSKTKGAALSSWSKYMTRSKLSNDPRPPSGGSGNTAPRCDRVGSAYVQMVTPFRELGYYNLKVSWDWKRFSNAQWVGDGKVLWNNWTSGSTQKGSAANFWTYNCRPDAPQNLTEGPYNSQGAIPDRDQFVNSANCIQAKWECEIATPSTLGYDKAQVNSGAVNPKSAAYVMRNGQKVPLNFATVRIVDLTGNGRQDVTNGNAGTGVRNITKIEYKNNVEAGSTPFRGDSKKADDANASGQYFQLFNGSATSNGTADKFNVWRTKANAASEVTKSITFNWASDPGSKFVIQRVWRVSGEFRIPQGGSGDMVSKPAPSGGFNWIKGTYNCMEYTGTGSNRKQTGQPLIAETNDAVVVRSVSSIPKP